MAENKALNEEAFVEMAHTMGFDLAHACAAAADAFARPLEIIKCKEGNKEYMKERPARKPYGRIVKVCEFSLEAVAEFGDDDARAVWRLAKRAARDFLRVSWINTAIVTTAKTDRPYMAVIVYGKY